MKRITVSMPEDLSQRLEREARRRGTSVSEVVRISLTELLEAGRSREIPWAGLVCEPDMTYGAQMDGALEVEWADDIAGDSR